MTGTADSLLSILLQPYGGNPDAWGGLLNTDALTLIGQAVKGTATISSAGGTYTLSNTSFVTNEARMAVWRNVGTQTSNLTLVAPPRQFVAWADNAGTSGGFTCSVGISGGLFVSLPYGRVTPVYSPDGVNTYTLAQRLDKIDVPTAFLNLNSQNISGLLAPTVSGHAATKGYVDSIASPTLNSVGAPTGNVDMAGYRLVTLGSPINPNDAVNLQALNGAIAAASLSGVSTLSAAPNTVLAGPAEGAAASTPVFRALVTADIPQDATVLAGQIFGAA